MKKVICTAIITTLCILCTSCTYGNQGEDIHETSSTPAFTSEHIENPDNEENVYDLNDLQTFFAGRTHVEAFFIEGEQDVLEYDEVNNAFLIDKSNRELPYSVFNTRQGGKFYAFWLRDLDGNYSIVYSTAYLDSSLKLSDFDSLEVGVSTAEDVIKIDPSSDFCLMVSMGTYSYSYIDGETLLEIEYDFMDEFNGYDDVIVKNITVVGRDTLSHSKFGIILPEDLP